MGEFSNSSYEVYLPHSALLNIFQHLHPRDLCACAVTSKAWKEFLQQHDKEVWQNHCIGLQSNSVAFPEQPSQQMTDVNHVTFKDRFKVMLLTACDCALLHLEDLERHCEDTQDSLLWNASLVQRPLGNLSFGNLKANLVHQQSELENSVALQLLRGWLKFCPEVDFNKAVSSLEEVLHELSKVTVSNSFRMAGQGRYEELLCRILDHGSFPRQHVLGQAPSCEKRILVIKLELASRRLGIARCAIARMRKQAATLKTRITADLTSTMNTTSNRVASSSGTDA